MIYYVSTSGNDANNGTSEITAWKSIKEVNSNIYNPGDYILFKRGDIFIGQINVGQSGSIGNEITFGAYGIGNDPSIICFETITGWTNINGVIYSATTTTANTCKMVAINGVNTPKGRYPNTGFLTFESKTINSITDNQLSGTPDWTGAEAVVRVNAFVYETRTITSHSGNTLSFANLYATPTSGNGYFFQNDLKCLDLFGDWYIKDGIIYMCFGALNPNDYTIQVAKETYGIYVNAKNYITIDGFDIQGAATNCIRGSNSSNLIIKNCKASLSGTTAISVPSSNYATIEDCIITDVNGTGINASGTNTIIKNNKISNIALYAGMQSLWQVNGISSTGDNSLVDLNTIENVGYNGILFLGDNTVVKRNKIDGFCTKMTDGGGIYTDGKVVQEDGKIIENNIIINGIFDNSGTSLTQSGTIGIYLDELDINTIVNNNSVADIIGYGILLHSCHNVNVIDNTVYNCSLSQLCFSHNTSAPNQTDINVSGNILVAKEATQKVFMQYSDYNDYLFGSADNNIYARPIDDNDVISIETLATWNSPTVRHNLAWWQTFSGYDINSKKSPKAITSLDDLYFIYNDTNIAKTFLISSPKMDIIGNIHIDSIILQPFTSMILIEYSNNIKYLTSDTTKYLISDTGKLIYITI